MKILITGGAGFIGHHVVQDILSRTDWNVTLIDRLDSSGNLNRLAEIGCPNARARFFYHDLRAALGDQHCAQLGEHDMIVHLAAGTHVDRSIVDPPAFVLENVLATCNLLEYVRKVGCERFLYFGTDEVFGPAPDGVRFKEWDRYKSGNPYAATKAGGEELAIAYQNTYGLPVIVTHTMNVFGERQHPEKFIPSTIRKIRDGHLVTVHSNKERTKAGSRFYIHARHVADAIRFVLAHGTPGDKYNIVGEREVDNLELATLIAAGVGRPLHYEMVDFHSSRPGHDLRYALDGSKLEAMGWHAARSFEESLNETITWSLRNDRWLLS